MKFSSRVIHGRTHGRTIGYPTANLELTEAVTRALEKEGVYAVRVRTKTGEYPGALFFGKRSLFNDKEPLCEVLLLDFVGDLYGQEVAVEVIKYLRPVVAVKNEDQLKRLIDQDIKEANQLFNQ